MIQLTKDENLAMHRWLIDRYGGIRGVRDGTLPDSALKAAGGTNNTRLLLRKQRVCAMAL